MPRRETENYSPNDKITVYEYLMHYTNVGDRCDILDEGWNAISCIIDSEDLFIKYIDEDLLWNTYVEEVTVEEVEVKSVDGTEKEIRRTIYAYAIHDDEDEDEEEDD